MRATEKMKEQPVSEADFSKLFNRGKELLKKGDAGAALKDLKAAHKLKPEHDALLNLLGMAYFRLEKHEEAEKIYLRLIKTNPDIHILRSNLGLIYFKENRLAEAEKHLSEAARIKPEHQKTHFYLGLVYYKQRQLEKALEKFREARADKMIQKVRTELDAAKETKRSGELFVKDEVGRAEKREAPKSSSKSAREDDSMNMLLSSLEPVKEKSRVEFDDNATMRIEKEELIKEVTPDEEEAEKGKEVIPEDKDEILREISRTESGRHGEFEAILDVCTPDDREKLPETFRFLGESSMEVSFIHELTIQHGSPFVIIGKTDCSPAGFSSRFTRCTGEGKVVIGGNNDRLYFMYIKVSELHIRVDNLLLISEGLNPYLVKTFGEDFVCVSGEGYVVMRAGRGLGEYDISEGDFGFAPFEELIGYAAAGLQGADEEDLPGLVSKKGNLVKITGRGALLIDAG